MPLPVAIAYHGKPELKTKAIAEISAHRAADRIVKGTYGGVEPSHPGFKGCMIGCLGGIRRHQGVLEDYGLPVDLTSLFDAIFEGLPEPNCFDFTTNALLAISDKGADVSLVASHFALWALSDPDTGLISFLDPKTREVGEPIISLYKRRIAGDEPSDKEWTDAADAAWVYAGMAYAGMADAGMADAAWVYAGMAYAGMADAGMVYAARFYAARFYAAWAYAGMADAWKEMAAKLLSLLADAPLS